MRTACTSTSSRFGPGTSSALPRLDSLPRLEAAEQLLAKQSGIQALLARWRIEALIRLDREIKQLEREIAQSVKAIGSGLPQLVGISYLSAARIIGEVGDVGRIASKARFARMNGTAPIPASSGQTQRHRLNKGGNRRLNHALHMMALTQARMDPRRPSLRRAPPRRRPNQTRRRARAQASSLRRRLPATPPGRAALRGASGRLTGCTDRSQARRTALNAPLRTRARQERRSRALTPDQAAHDQQRELAQRLSAAATTTRNDTDRRRCTTSVNDLT